MDVRRYYKSTLEKFKKQIIAVEKAHSNTFKDELKHKSVGRGGVGNLLRNIKLLPMGYGIIA